MIVTAAALAEAVLSAASRCSALADGDLRVDVKADGTPVTRLDLAIDEELRASLPRIHSEAGWLSEESGRTEPVAGGSWMWIVDPLDGTKEIARGIRECAISVGLVDGETVRAAAVANPFTGLWASSGTDGSWRASTEHAERPEPGISVSRTEVEDGSLAEVMRTPGPWRPVGSVAYKMLRVAVGIDEATVSVQPKSEWDICGGVALLRARGGDCLRLDGQPLRFNQASTRIPGGFVAGPAGRLAGLLAQVSR